MISHDQGIPLTDMVLVAYGGFLYDNNTLAESDLKKDSIIVQAYLIETQDRRSYCTGGNYEITIFF